MTTAATTNGQTPCCGRAVRGFYTGHQCATEVVRRTCPACRTRYAVRVRPMRSNAPGVSLHELTWTPTEEYEPMTTLLWNRSEGGNTDSKCGRYSVEAQYMGCTTAQAYGVYRNESDGTRVTVNRYCSTQRDAKQYAQWDADKAEETNR